MLLEKDGSVSIHDRNIQCVATEMYKVSNWLSTPLVSNIFRQKNSHPYNLRLNSQFSRPFVRSDGTESISYLGPAIWDIIPDSYPLFLKSGLKNGNLRIVPAVFAKHRFPELVLYRLPLR